MSDSRIESPTLRFRRLDAAAFELAELLREGKISTLFQPIVDPRTRAIVGFEALARGPSDSWLHSPQNLFEAARRSGVKSDVDFACMQSAFKRFVSSRAAGLLFVNVSPETIYEEANFAQQFLSFARNALVPIERCVIELTEESLLDDYVRLRATLQTLRDAGCGLAIDDLGAGFSGLRTWSELKPDYVKIDRYFISGIDSDPTKLEFVRSILDMGRAIGCRVIAEGVETEKECRELVNLGIDRLQGHLFGRPNLAPQTAMQSLESLDRPLPASGAVTAEKIAVFVQAIAPEMRVVDAVEIFKQKPELLTLPVARDGKPLGAVRRDDLFSLLAKPLHADLYAKKPVSAIMEAPTLTVDSQLKLEQVSRLVTQKGRGRLTEEFLITKEGRYHGIGRTLDLLRQITEQQLQSAKHSNPVTLLPGNAAVRACIDRLIADNKRFIVCYFDVDAFKPYSAEYGAERSEQTILALGNMLKSSFSSRLDFVGHVGDDDFVVVVRSADFRKRVKNVVAEFQAALPSFHRAEHLEQGHLTTTDRTGTERKFPLLSLSVTALDSKTEGATSSEAIAEMLVEVRKIAKRKSASSYVIKSGERLMQLLPSAQREPERDTVTEVGAEIDQLLTA